MYRRFLNILRNRIFAVPTALMYCFPSISGLVSGIIARQDVVPDVLPPIPVTILFVEDLSAKGQSLVVVLQVSG